MGKKGDLSSMSYWTASFLAKFDVAEFLNVGSCSRKVESCSLNQVESSKKKLNQVNI